MTLAPDDPRHGTENGYSNLDCRCQPCRDAFAARMRKYKARIRAEHREPPEHGTRYAYEFFKCRCARCVDGCRRREGRLPIGPRPTARDVTMPSAPTTSPGLVARWITANSTESIKSLSEYRGSRVRPGVSAVPARRRGTNGWSMADLDRIHPDGTCGVIGDAT
jgi:hypothetical protein